MNEPPSRYDAFLSYSQRDHATVAWLRILLSDYWVPGRKRRAIFLDRQSMGAGVLDAGLVEALRESKFLIVCCSENARDSSWVDREVAAFLQTHEDRLVLICAVGDAHEAVFPRSIEALQQRRGHLRWPDLRGFPEAKPKREQRPAVEEALSLLAEILGFAGKDALVDSVARGRALRRRLTAAGVAMAMLAGGGVWTWLNLTTSGALYLTRQRVLRAADTEIRDDPYLASTAHAFGVMDRPRDVERLAATVKDHDFRGLVLAAGFAALPQPDCARARTALEGLDRASARMGANSLLLLAKCCGGTWEQFARPDPLNGDSLLSWGRALAETGHGEAARDLLKRPDFLPRDRLPLLVAIAIGTGGPLQLAPSDLVAWSGDETPADRLYAAVQELEKLDLGARLADAGSQELRQYGLEALVELSSKGFGNWNQQQELAAHYAGIGSATAASLLGAIPDGAADSPDDAPGLAWRALALHRLGRDREGVACFDLAERAGRTFTPQSRSWREWFDVATAASLAGDWRRACAAAEAPGNEATRFSLRCYVLQLWAYHDHPRVRW